MIYTKRGGTDPVFGKLHSIDGRILRSTGDCRTISTRTCALPGPTTRQVQAVGTNEHDRGLTHTRKSIGTSHFRQTSLDL